MVELFNSIIQYSYYRSEIVRCSDWSTTASIDGNVKEMFFSPLDNFFMVWEMYAITKDNPEVNNDFFPKNLIILVYFILKTVMYYF